MLRLFIWTSGTLFSALAIGGAEALAQPVSLPLWIVLALTFVPMKELVRVFRRGVESLAPPEENDGN